ncbi:uncharacterized protein LOC122859280 [Aphidius gifuensis]|uniref:uncharacterized protein LOC122859280 n=1 Tax=Aphidius gifuensis TaxID=684658 RepID=UPI001CDD1C53|nr:uncharacterized protein LOC122859280 [Aphidius gifuensis]
MILINVGLLLFIVTSSKLISCTELDSKNLKYKLASKFGLIDVSTKSEVIKNKDLLQACLDDFVTSHLKKQPKIITVILNKHVKMSNIYLEEIQKSYPTFVFTEDYNGQNNMKKTRMNIFILLRNHNDLGDFQIKIHQISSRGSTYTVFLVDHFKNKKLFIEESNLLTKLLWIKKIANIVIIGFVENYYLAMNSNKFKPNILREPMDPVIVGQCQNGKWIINITLFEPMKMNNCSVNVGYLNYAPYMYAVKQKNNNKLEYKGIDLSILRVVANHLNFTINLSEIVRTENDTKTQIIANSFDNNRSYDIVIGGIIWQSTIDIDYTIPHDAAQLVWLVPVLYKKISPLPFPTTAKKLILIIVVILFPIIVKFILFHEISFFEMFAVFLGIPYNRRPLRFSFIIFLMFWFLLGFMLAQLSSSSLLTRIKDESTATNYTIKKLIKSGIAIGGLKDTKSLFIGNETFENYKEFERIEYEKQLQDLMNGKNKKMTLLMVMDPSTVNTKFDPYHVYVLPEASIQLQFSFAVWHGLPYVNELDIILQRLIRSGIITHFRHIETKSRDIEFNPIAFKRLNYSHCYLLLGIGLAISLITLIFEIINFRFKLIDRIYSVYLKLAHRV